MGNRVTDQTSQNGLIEKFSLKGELPEMEVSPVIQPVVQVATLDDGLSVSEFEKWRSVFSVSAELIDVANVHVDAIAFQAGVTKCDLSSTVHTFLGACTAVGRWGCATPGGSAGNHSTDGIYRITISSVVLTPAIFVGTVSLYDQAAFGDPVALGTLRQSIGTWTTMQPHEGPVIIFDKFVKILTTDQINSVLLDFSIGTAGTGAMAMTVTKLIDEVPPFVIFP